MIADQVAEFVKSAIIELGLPTSQLIVEASADQLFGDFTTNIALRLSREQHVTPIKLAEKIADVITRKSSPLIARCSVAKPGFINLTLTPKVLAEYAIDLINSEKPIVEPRVGSIELEMYENTGPNTNKPLHIGHLRNAAIGVSLVTIRKLLGAKALSVNINNDRGAHICKAMIGYLYSGSKSDVQPINKNWRALVESWLHNPNDWQLPAEATGLMRKPDHFVGQFYIEGNKLEQEYESIKQAISAMLQEWELGNNAVRALWSTMNNWFYEGFRQTHARFLGIQPTDPQYDKEWYESELYQAGQEIVLQNLGKGLFEKRSDGAVIAKLERYGLPEKVVIRSDGTALYVTQDLELSRQRVQQDNASLDARVVASEQELYFRQLFAMCEVLGFGTLKNYLHISYGMVNLKGGEKMSSRKGTVVYADDLMETVKQQVSRNFSNLSTDSAEAIAIGAIKYWMLKYNSKAEIEFDINESISLGGNSGPYLQYTFARIQTLLEKGQPGNRTLTIISDGLGDDELILLRFLIKYQEAIEAASANHAPNLLANYLYGLAKKYNLFYQNVPVLQAGSEMLTVNRLALSKAVGFILQHGLTTLGIPTLERM